MTHDEMTIAVCPDCGESRYEVWLPRPRVLPPYICICRLKQRPLDTARLMRALLIASVWRELSVAERERRIYRGKHQQSPPVFG